MSDMEGDTMTTPKPRSRGGGLSRAAVRLCAVLLSLCAVLSVEAATGLLSRGIASVFLYVQASHDRGVALRFQITHGRADALNVQGPGTPAFSDWLIIFVLNDDPVRSQRLSVMLARGENVALISDGCSGMRLGPGHRCPLALRAQADHSGPISDHLVVVAGSRRLSLALRGEARGFRPPQIALKVLRGDVSALNVRGHGAPARGAPVVVAVRNIGEQPSAPLVAALANGTNVRLEADDCLGRRLAAGERCHLSLYPFATTNGPIEDTLFVTADNGKSLALSGFARGLAVARPAVLSPEL